MKYQLTIIVPVYNEEESLPKVYETLLDYFAITPVASKVLFVNDGSTDESQLFIENICREDERFEFALLAQNQGLSTAIKAGIDLCDTPYLGYMDADLQTTPKDFLLYFDYLGSYTMINGIRAHRNDKLLKKLSSRIANTFRRVMINDGIADTCCPLKIMETSYAKRLPFFKGMHRFIPAMIQLQGGKVKQIEVRHFPRFAGTAKYHLWNRLIGPFYDTLAFIWMKRRWINYQVKSERKSNPKKMEKAPVNE